MFDDRLVERYTWRNRGKSKVNPPVRTGVYVVEHVPTGKLYMESGADIGSSVRSAVAELESGKHPCKRLQGCVNLECDLQVYEYPTRTLREARQLEDRLKETITPTYLLTNPVETAGNTKSKRKPNRV